MTIPIPEMLDADVLASIIRVTPDGINKLNELKDRGIILNTWQANTLLLKGRGFGKTFLQYVILAEDHKDCGFIITIDQDLTMYDAHLIKAQDKYFFIKELDAFLKKYYSDIFDVNLYYRSIEVTPKEKIKKSWW